MKKLLSLGVLLMMLGLWCGPAFADNVVLEWGPAGPPPPVREEVMAPAPGPAEGWAWHKGHWRLIDYQWVWVPGHWVRRPHPQAEWVEPTWNGTVFVEGHWR